MQKSVKKAIKAKNYSVFHQMKEVLRILYNKSMYICTRHSNNQFFASPEKLEKRKCLGIVLTRPCNQMSGYCADTAI